MATRKTVATLLKGKGSDLLVSEQRKVFVDHVNVLDVLRWVLQYAEEGIPLTSDKFRNFVRLSYEFIPEGV